MKSGTCTICLEPLIKDCQVAHCGHVFHRPCIYRWIDSKSECPNCKQHLDASELTKLFLNPLDIIKEVMEDPSVLEDVDPDLLLKFSMGNSAGKTMDGDDDDIDLKSLATTDSKKSNLKMELMQQRIQTTALTKKNQELNQKMVILNENMRTIEDEKSKLNRKIQRCLKTAQVCENKYFEAEAKVTRLTKDLYKKTKQLNATKADIDKFVRQQQMNEHCENIMIGNVNAVNEIESRMEQQTPQQQAQHYKNMYDWMMKEKMKKSKEYTAEKTDMRRDMQRLREMNEENRIEIEDLNKCIAKQVEKKEHAKKSYFDLKQRFLAQKEKFKTLCEKYRALREQQSAAPAVSTSSSVPEIGNLSVLEGPTGDDDVHSISHSESHCENNAENVIPNAMNEGGLLLNVDDEEDDDLLRTKCDGNVDSVFAYPSSQGQQEMSSSSQQNTFQRRQQSSNSLFGAYRKIKQRNNPFSNKNKVGKKRNFSQFATKGDDGRGGTNKFLNDTTSNMRNNRNKRRRVVNSATSSNANKKKRNNITNFFKRN